MTLPARLEQPVRDDQKDAADDGAVGHIEGRPVPAGQVEVEKVHYPRLMETVDGVAHRPANDQSDSPDQQGAGLRSEEHTSELQSLMRISYAGFCLKKKKKSN